MNGVLGAGEIARTAAQATRTIGTARSQAVALRRLARRLDLILRNSATLRARDRVTRSPAHQSCAASSKAGPGQHSL